MKTLYHPDVKFEKSQLKTRVNLINFYDKCIDKGGADTPRSATSEVSQSQDEIKPEPKVKKSPEKCQDDCDNFQYVTVTKWVDYSHKYGVGYYLSNNTVGVVFNDDTKMTHNLKSDRLHYFNSMDLLTHSIDKFSKQAMSEKDRDLKKKVKILNYLKKVLTNGDAKCSITKARASEFDQTAIFIKKWSYIDNKLVFKMNLKIMHIILSPDREILLKYDTGIATYFSKQEAPITLNLPEDLKLTIFSNTTSLGYKIE